MLLRLEGCQDRPISPDLPTLFIPHLLYLRQEKEPEKLGNLARNCVATSKFLIYCELEKFVEGAFMKIPVLRAAEAGSSLDRLDISAPLSTALIK